MNLKETLQAHRYELQKAKEERYPFHVIYDIMERQEEEINELLANIIYDDIMMKIKSSHYDTSRTRPLGKKLR